eukprot:TRINITY_DN7661_c3_g1_i3.p2 TRINITY_DN7661_c3_g1~~TRINITY_DN7661_c3_g1_i3.p2  ORF type:complete len:178 (-),score=18.80 TRINITY_DN7661_c3_g1_i3:274-807(-)
MWVRLGKQIQAPVMLPDNGELRVEREIFQEFAMGRVKNFLLGQRQQRWVEDATIAYFLPQMLPSPSQIYRDLKKVSFVASPGLISFFLMCLSNHFLISFEKIGFADIRQAVCPFCGSPLSINNLLFLCVSPLLVGLREQYALPDSPKNLLFVNFIGFKFSMRLESADLRSIFYDICS